MNDPVAQVGGLVAEMLQRGVVVLLVLSERLGLEPRDDRNAKRS